MPIKCKQFVCCKFVEFIQIIFEYVVEIEIEIFFVSRLYDKQDKRYDTTNDHRLLQI